jgi:hypothetical protein
MTHAQATALNLLAHRVCGVAEDLRYRTVSLFGRQQRRCSEANGLGAFAWFLSSWMRRSPAVQNLGVDSSGQFSSSEGP